MDIRFDNKAVVVTGARDGLGRRMTERFLECGAKVYRSDIRLMVLNSLRRKAQRPR